MKSDRFTTPILSGLEQFEMGKSMERIRLGRGLFETAKFIIPAQLGVARLTTTGRFTTPTPIGRGMPAKVRRLLLVAFFSPFFTFAENGTIYQTSGEMWGRDSGGTLYKNTSEIWGRVTESGTIYRTDGQIWGRVSEGGAIYRTDGQIWWRVSK